MLTVEIIFIKLAIYIFFSCRCRHAFFAKYFGDPPPNCTNRCDVCKNKNEVQAKITQFELSATASYNSRNYGSRAAVDPDAFGLEKYDWWVLHCWCFIRRRKLILLINSFYSCEEENEGESRDRFKAEEKKEREKEIQQQFLLRRGNKGDSSKKVKNFVIKQNDKQLFENLLFCRLKKKISLLRETRISLLLR